MRTIESSLLVANLILLMCCLFAQMAPRWAILVSVVTSLILGLHLVVEGWRWQMAPGYLTTLVLCAATAWPRFVKLGIWSGATLLVCLLGVLVLGTILPVFDFPAPTGPFAIGSVIRHFVDSTRLETQSGREGEKRELMVQIWYPTDQAGVPQYYRANIPATFKNQHIRLVKLHSCSGVPIAKANTRFPVLIFSPSWTGNCNQYTFLAEELASHGFIVIGIDHPYGSDPTIFPDGRTIPTALTQWLDYSSDEALQASLQVVENQLKLRATDIRFTLDELQRLDREDPNGLLTDRIDTLRVGVYGHSFGGAVAAEVCQTDSRIKAAINFDGLMFGESASVGVKKPFMYISDDGPIPTAKEVAGASGAGRRRLIVIDQDVQNIRRSLRNNGGYWLTIRGASHLNFVDSPLYTPIRRFTGAGPIDPNRALEICKVYSVAFFKKQLCSQDNKLLDGPSSQHPDVEFEAWPACPQ